MTLNFQDLQKACAERADSKAFSHGLRDWSLTQWTNALAGETGELCNFAKKVERDGVNHDVDMGKEIADIVIYAIIVAEYVGIEFQHDWDFNDLNDVHLIPDDLKLHPLTHWTNILAARTGALCMFSEQNSKDKEDLWGCLLGIVIHCEVVAQYIGLDLGEEVRKKFNEVSEKRGVDIKL